MKYADRFIKMAKAGTVPESTIAKMAEFKANLEQHSITKVASNGGGGPTINLTKMLLLAGAMGTAPYAIGGVVNFVQRILEDRKKGPAFQQMLEYHPALKKEDQETIARYFDSVWHFSPHMAQDPLAAGAYIRAALQYHGVYGGPAANMVKDVGSIQKERAEATRGMHPAEYFMQRIPSPGFDNIDPTW